MFAQFLKEEKGQTTVEYLLIIAVVVVVISVLGKQIQGKIGMVVNSVFQGVQAKIGELTGQSSQH